MTRSLGPVTWGTRSWDSRTFGFAPHLMLGGHVDLRHTTRYNYLKTWASNPPPSSLTRLGLEERDAGRPSDRGERTRVPTCKIDTLFMFNKKSTHSKHSKQPSVFGTCKHSKLLLSASCCSQLLSSTSCSAWFRINTFGRCPATCT